MRLILFNKNGNSSNKVIERIEIYMICKMRVLILKRYKESIISGLYMFLKGKYHVDFSIVSTLNGAKNELRTFKNQLHAIIVGQYLEDGSNGIDLIHYTNELNVNISILLASTMSVRDKRLSKYDNVKIYRINGRDEHLVYYDFLEERYKQITRWLGSG